MYSFPKILPLKRNCWDNRICLWNTNMSPVKVKVIGQNFLYEWGALVTRNLHAKYECSIWKDSKLMTMLKLSNKRTNKQTGQKQYLPAIPTGDIKIPICSSKIGNKVIKVFIYFFFFFKYPKKPTLWIFIRIISADINKCTQNMFCGVLKTTFLYIS